MQAKQRRQMHPAYLFRYTVTMKRPILALVLLAVSSSAAV